MQRKFLMVLAATSLAFAATSPAGATAPDTTNTSGPSHTGAKLVISEKISGHILPDMTDTFVMYSRADRRANVVIKAHVDGWLGRFANHYNVGKPPLHADIFRMDQNDAYKVLFHQKQYWQCQLEGCPTIYKFLESVMKPSDEASQDASTWHPTGTNDCPLTPVSHDYRVQKTAQSKTINGFPAHLYVATFKTVYADSAHRTNTSTLKWTFWTTPITGEIQRIWAIHEALAKRFLKSSGANDNPWARFVSRKVWQPLDAFLGDTDSHAHNWSGDVTSKLAQVEGYPVRIKVAWYVDAHACPAPKPQTESDTQTLADNAGGGLRGMLGGLIRKHVEKHVEKAIDKHFQPDPDTPVFEYDRNILSAKITSIPDSVFHVPAGFVRKPTPKVSDVDWYDRHDKTD
ncbi:MAG TPA: hypothetical protein VF271_01270 [Rhodanobacteraceae bacterium]